MSERTSARAETSVEPDNRLTTEADALCSVLLDMGLTLAVDLDDDRLFVAIDEDSEPAAGAMSLFNIVAVRMDGDAQFRDDVISAVSHLGHYLAKAPGIDADLKTAPATKLFRALALAGLLIRHHYEGDDGHTPMLSFMPVPGMILQPNAHMLMKLTVDRFTDEPDFARAVTDYVVASGRSQHSA